MTFSHCKTTAKISLVIFPIAVNISKRYPLDIFFYLERKCNECDNCIICGCTCNVVDNNNNKRDRKCNDECPPHKCKKLVFEDTRNNDDSVSVDLQDTSNIIKDILHILRMEPDSSLITHLPSKKIKSELSTWNDNSLEAKDARTIVLNVYKEFLRRFAVALVGEIAAERSVEKAIEDMSGYRGNVLTQIMSVSTNKRSIEYRTVRAMLVHTTKRKELIKENSLSCNSYKKGNVDLQQLLKGKKLFRVFRSVQKFNPLAVDSALAFILSSENVSYTSWGTKTFHLNGIDHVFPAVTRKKTRAIMYRNYCANQQIPPIHKLKRTAFYMITSKLTHADPKLRKSVDYVTRFLINDNFKIIENVINHFMRSAIEKEKIIRKMELVRRFLKYDFDKGVAGHSNCKAHDFSLGLGFPSDTTLQKKKRIYVVDVYCRISFSMNLATS